MEFQFEPQDYLNHLEEYMELDEVTFTPDQSKEEIISRLKEISKRKKEISDIQNRIIEEYVERFEKGRAELDEQAAEKLFVLMTILFVKEQKQSYDAPVMFRLAKVLYPYYEKQQNLERIIQVIYYGSLSEFFMKIGLEQFPFLEFPKYCEAYFPKLSEMSKEVREELISVYNLCIVTKEDAELPKIVELYPRMKENFLLFLKDEQVLDMAKRSLLILQINFLSFSTIMIRLDGEKIKHGKPPMYHFNVEKYKGLFEECVKEIEDGLESIQLDRFTTESTKMQLLFVRYHIGQISFEEMIQGMEPYRFTEEEDPVSQMTMLNSNMMYLNYIYAFSPYSPEEDERLGRECIQKVMPKILEMKKQKMYMFAPMIVNFLGATSFYTLDFYDFYEIALEFTVYADKALYVHTVMVKEICHLILERILEERPELIDGVNGWNIEYIKTHKNAVLAMMDMCAMCHDIGKHYIIDVVSNSSRRLSDDEFGIIKQHPQYFEEFYQKPDEEKMQITCIRDCAVLHHRWHNGQGGYPELLHTANRPFVDILAIADSLDAATDYIGRPYGAGKSLDALLNEFLEMGGTRYSKEVAEILNESSVKAAVADVITKRREEVNYRIYAFHEIEGK